ncbi:MAG: sensor domain-containing diguanylate cyclase [Acidimicrobiales bacterium]|nr:sensor domain-containing diguanylate cyclase [Acidimicrobiales bacterium]
MSGLLRRQSGGTTSRRTRTPLARRFQYRYALAIATFAGIAVFNFASVSRSLDRIDNTSRQLSAASAQIARIYKVADLSQQLVDPAISDRQVTASNLKVELNNLGQTMQGLMRGDQALNLPAISLNGELSDLYLGSFKLAQTIEDLTAAGDNLVASASRVETSVTQLRSDAEKVLSHKDRAIEGYTRAVQVYDNELFHVIDSGRQVQSWLIIIDGVVAVLMVTVLFQPMARSIHNETTQLEEAERIHRENNERQTFRNELQQALEVTDTEEEVLAAVGRAVTAIIPGNKCELLLSDSSQSHLRKSQVNPTLGGPNCPVESPWGCAAIRRGQTMVYESSRMLNVCPKLPEHDGGAHSAVCVPVMFMGRSLGVLHTTGPDGKPPSHTEIERLTVLASETGSRLGNLRATRATELQASTDGLTGLLNRRSLEAKARSLMLDSRYFSIAIADLDHFKDLNDTYGHEAGDRALRLFAKTLKDNLRPDDIPARYGGEEFVVLLPDTNILDAKAALERLQEALANDVQRSGTTPFTASWGLTDNTAGSTFDEMVAVADAALYSAKRAGRNCIMVDGEAAGKWLGTTGTAAPPTRASAGYGPGDGRTSPSTEVITSTESFGQQPGDLARTRPATRGSSDEVSF